VIGKAIAAGEFGLRLLAQNPRLAPCGSPIGAAKATGDATRQRSSALLDKASSGTPICQDALLLYHYD